MKTYEEMARSALLKIEEHEVLREKRKKLVLRTVIPAFVLLIAAAFVFGVWMPKNDAKIQSTESIPVLIESTPSSEAEAVPQENGKAGLPASRSTCDDTVPNSGKKVIASYPEIENPAEGCYAAPENGTFFYTVPLRLALEHYGDEANYRVIVSVWSDLNNDFSAETYMQEAERLNSLGYDAEVNDQIVNGNGDIDYILTMQASKAALETFPARADHGYVICLYGERLPTDDELYSEVQQYITAEY